MKISFGEELGDRSKDVEKKSIEKMKKKTCTDTDKEDIQMAKKHRRCSTLLARKEVQIKITMRHYFTPIRIVKIKK